MLPVKLNPWKVAWIGSSLAVLVTSGVYWSQSGPYCAVMPRAYWLSPLEVEWRLKEKGYRLAQIKVVNDRCYSIVARDTMGNFVDIVMHPATSDILYKSTPK